MKAEEIKYFIEWRDKLKKEVRGGVLMFDVPKRHKWLSESELFEYWMDSENIEPSLSTTISNIQPSADLKGEILAKHIKDLNQLVTPLHECINQIGNAMEEYRNQPVKQPNDIKKQLPPPNLKVKLFDLNANWESTGWILESGTWSVKWKDGMPKFPIPTHWELIVVFTPQRTPKEEAERVVELFADIDFEDSVLRSIQVVSYNIDSLKLRGLSTQYEEEVLTILKWM